MTTDNQQMLHDIFHKIEVEQTLTMCKKQSFIKQSDLKDIMKEKTKSKKTKSLKSLNINCKDKYRLSASTKEVKLEINKMVAQSFKSVDSNKGTFVILESPAMTTTKHLIKEGISKRRIEIPNHTDSYKEIRKKHKNTYNMTVGEYIGMLAETETKNQIEGIWLDYMGTIHGNTEIKPKEDILSLFNDGLLASESIIAYTFSYMDFHHGKKTHTHQDKYDIERYLQELAYSKGYSVVREQYGKIYQGMFFDMFKVRKI